MGLNAASMRCVYPVAVNITDPYTHPWMYVMMTVCHRDIPAIQFNVKMEAPKNKR
jgi:hypothetical protein